MPDPERLIEKTFAANGWGDMWRNGIYPCVHYHSMIHEGLGVARGRAKVRFGGDNGREIELRPATSPSCRRAPVINASPKARTSWPSAPIRRGQIRPLPRQQGRAREGACLDPASAAPCARQLEQWTSGTVFGPGMSHRQRRRFRAPLCCVMLTPVSVIVSPGCVARKP
jgi:hypothetical protein